MSLGLCIIAAGGTGGHIFPAQALAEVLISRGWRVILLTDRRGLKYAQKFPNSVQIKTIVSASFSRGGFTKRLTVVIKLLRAILSTYFLLRRLRPKIIIGFGGYCSFPPLLVGGWLGIDRVVHEQNAILGRVNRFFARRMVPVSYSISPIALPSGVTAINIGNPVRKDILSFAEAVYLLPKHNTINILVIGGSQGAQILSHIVPEAIALLPMELRRSLQIFQQVRAEDKEYCRMAYNALGVNFSVSTFFNNIAKHIDQAQLVIARAGASSIADITLIGRPSILIPLASAVDDHQNLNAQALAHVGAAFILTEVNLSANELAKNIKLILTDTSRAAMMAGAAASLGRPKAALALADMIESL